MGIRFYCPNGHKLNVKEFQAGRRGICPFCGAKIQIPTQSTRPSSRAAQQRQRSESGGDVEGDPTSPPASATPPDEIVIDGPPGPEVAPVEPVVVSRAVAEAKAPVATSTAEVPPQANPEPSPPTAPPRQPAGTDPITEAPEMIWYVRPPSGGQFGPAAGDVMRNWLAEGRVSADSLLWREGWRDWQEAGNVFPQLRSGQSTAFLETVPVVSAVKPTAAPVHVKHRRHTDNTQLTVILMVSMAVIILLAVFIYVLFRQ